MKVLQNYIPTLNFLKEIINNIWKHIDLQSQALCVDKNNLKKILYVLEDGASSVPVGDVEQKIV